MGCDIHMFIEKRLREEDAWRLDDNHTVGKDGFIYQINAINRTYKLFAILANVRGHGALYPPRGIPEDSSEELLRGSGESDWHSHSWLTIDEFKRCLVKADYNLAKNKSSDAFFDYSPFARGHLDFADAPEAYTTVVNYCEEWIANEKAEAIMLDQTDVKPEVRIIFWFDN